MIESGTIITSEANGVLRDIHDQMAAILNADDVVVWLDTATKKRNTFKLLQPCSDETLEAYPVAALVNRPRHNQPEFLARVDSREIDRQWRMEVLRIQET